VIIRSLSDATRAAKQHMQEAEGCHADCRRCPAIRVQQCMQVRDTIFQAAMGYTPHGKPRKVRSAV
jgi:hypothetical protein